LFAQQPDAADAASQGKPAVTPTQVEIPQANPARPTITNPATLPPVGYLQFEQGLLEAGSSPDGLERQFSVVQTMKLAVHPRLMLQFASQPIAVSKTIDAPGDPARSQTDTGDLLLGVQAVLVKGAGHRPTIAVGYLQRVRSGTAPDIDIGSFSRTGIVLISGDLGGFHYDSNFSVSEQSEDPVRRAQYGRTLSVSHPLFSEKLGLSGEIWNFTQPLVDTTRTGAASPRSEAVGMLWALGYTVRPNLVLDGGFDRGLTSTSTAWQGFVGFTYLLPHRLWRGGSQ
jgi:Putative MetA-pathway of phenol degradation